MTNAGIYASGEVAYQFSKHVTETDAARICHTPKLNLQIWLTNTWLNVSMWKFED